MASSPRHAAIIAGGLGSRAHGMTGDAIPKALLPVAGIPIILRQLRVLAREGVRSVTVLAGHLGDQLEPALAQEAACLSLELSVLIEMQPLGTAGCLTALAPAQTLIVYGDMLFDMDLARLANAHAASGALLTVVAHPNDHPETSDLVVEENGRARAILAAKLPRAADLRNLVPAGLYLASAGFFAELAPQKRADMIHDVLPRLVRERIVGVYNTPEYLRDVGTAPRHARAEADIRDDRMETANLHHSRPALFFDIDGVLNVEPGGHGVLSPDHVILLPHAAEALRKTCMAGFLAIGVTNRPQLAKGMVDEAGLQRIFGRLETLLAREGGWLDRIYYCPHHPETGHTGEVKALKIACHCRKPAPGLLEQAVKELNIGLHRSVMIGDSPRDIGAARAMGIGAFGVKTGQGCREAAPDALFDGVLEAVKAAVAAP